VDVPETCRCWSLRGLTSIVPVRHQIFIFRRASPVKTRPRALLEINHADKAVWVRAALSGGTAWQHRKPSELGCSWHLPVDDERRSAYARLSRPADIRNPASWEYIATTSGWAHHPSLCHATALKAIRQRSVTQATIRINYRTEASSFGITSDWIGLHTHNADKRQSAKIVPYWLQSVWCRPIGYRPTFTPLRNNSSCRRTS